MAALMTALSVFFLILGVLTWNNIVAYKRLSLTSAIELIIYTGFAIVVTFAALRGW